MVLAFAASNCVCDMHKWLNCERWLTTCPLSNIFESATFSLRIRLPSTRIRWIRHMNPQLFKSALQSGTFWIRYESRIVWTLNPDIFSSGDVTRSHALRRMLCCQYSQKTRVNLEYYSESGYVLDTCGRANSIWIRIRVDVEILNPQRNSCGLNNIRIRVDVALVNKCKAMFSSGRLKISKYTWIKHLLQTNLASSVKPTNDKWFR